VKPYGIKFYQKGGSQHPVIVISIRDIKGKLWSFQYISPEGRKAYLNGGRKKGCFHLIGNIEDNILLLAEGYATSATLHEITGRSVLTCFDIYNIENVIEEMQKHYPNKKLIICADNDKWKEQNIGLEKAKAFSKENGVQYIYPEFADKYIEQQPTDFNDLFILEGKNSVTGQIESQYQGLVLELDSDQDLTDLDLSANNLQESLQVEPKSKLNSIEDKKISDSLEPDLSILESKLLPAPEFPLHVFPIDIQDWLHKAAEARNCPIDYIAVSLLTGIAGVMGNTRTVSPWSGWVEPLILWSALVGTPSSGKSPAMDAIAAPIYRVESDLSSSYQQEYEDYQTNTRINDIKRKDW